MLRAPCKHCGVGGRLAAPEIGYSMPNRARPHASEPSRLPRRCRNEGFDPPMTGSPGLGLGPADRPDDRSSRARSVGVRGPDSASSSRSAFQQGGNSSQADEAETAGGMIRCRCMPPESVADALRGPAAGSDRRAGAPVRARRAAGAALRVRGPARAPRSMRRRVSAWRGSRLSRRGSGCVR